MSGKSGTGKEEKPISEYLSKVTAVRNEGTMLQQKQKKVTTLKMAGWSIYTLASFCHSEGRS